MIEEIINKYIKFWPLYFKNQGKAAEALNISRSHFNKIINKRDFPSTTLLMRMENKIKKKKWDFKGASTTTLLLDILLVWIPIDDVVVLIAS